RWGPAARTRLARRSEYGPARLRDVLLPGSASSHRRSGRSADGAVCASGQARLGRGDIEIRKERFDVLWPLCGLVVEQERVLPHIHDDDRLEAGDVAVLVQGDPVIAE